jgi:hypothetical protein
LFDHSQSEEQLPGSRCVHCVFYPNQAGIEIAHNPVTHRYSRWEVRILLENAIPDGDGGSTIGKLASRIQVKRTFIHEEPRDQKSHIFKHFARKLSPESTCRSDSGNRFMDAIFDWTGET